MSTYSTEQEAFWAGEFGDAYIARNRGEQVLAGNIALFSQVLARTQEVRSVLELGANIGMNLLALHALMPEAQLHAVEINALAADQLRKLHCVRSVHKGSLLEYTPPQPFDFVFTKGVLIHLDPQVLTDVYDRLIAASNRYVLLAEYYNPSPVEIPYRGHGGRLFKRDFAGEMMARHPGLRLLDYGFRYRHDPNWPQDDITWFLLERT